MIATEYSKTCVKMATLKKTKNWFSKLLSHKVTKSVTMNIFQKKNIFFLNHL